MQFKMNVITNYKNISLLKDQVYDSEKLKIPEDVLIRWISRGLISNMSPESSGIIFKDEVNNPTIPALPENKSSEISQEKENKIIRNPKPGRLRSPVRNKKQR